MQGIETPQLAGKRELGRALTSRDRSRSRRTRPGAVAVLLAKFGVQQLGVGAAGFGLHGLRSVQPVRTTSSRAGTSGWKRRLGVLDIMQWVPGIDAHSAYATVP
jgi:hypothetical protein